MKNQDLIKILSSLPPDMSVYYKMYNVAGHLEEVAEIQDFKVETPPGYLTFPEVTENCIVLDCNISKGIKT